MLYALKAGNDILVDTVSSSMYACLCGAAIFDSPEDMCSGTLGEECLTDEGKEILMATGYRLVRVEVTEIPEK